MRCRVKRLIAFSGLIPNFPSFVPVAGEIVNFWIILSPLRVRRIRLDWIFALYVVGLLTFAISISTWTFSAKYVVIVFLPILVFITFSKMERTVLALIWPLLLGFIIMSFFHLFSFEEMDFLIRPMFGESAGLFGAGGGVRGVGLLYPEPSHAALLTVLFWSLYFEHRFRNRILNSVLFLGVVLVTYVTRSGSSALYLVVFFVLFALFDAKYKSSIVVGSVLFVVAFGSGLVFFPDLRFFAVFVKLFELLRSGALTIESTALISSGRFIANYVWFISGLKSILGFGFDIEVSKFIYLANEMGVDYRVIGAFERYGVEGLPVLPRSFLVTAVAVYGVLGFFVLGGYIFLFLRHRIIKSWAILGVAFFYLFVVGFPGNPIPWIMILLATVPRPRVDKFSNNNAQSGTACGQQL